MTDEQLAGHADAILRAAGSGLRFYTMPAVRQAILAEVRAVYEEGCERGESFAIESQRAFR